MIWDRLVRMAWRRYVRRMPVLAALDDPHRKMVMDRSAVAVHVRMWVVGFAYSAIMVMVGVALFSLFVMHAKAVDMDAGRSRAILLIGGLGYVTAFHAFGFLVGRYLAERLIVKRIKRWIRDGLCVACGYNLEGIDESKHCPECGAANLSGIWG